MTKKEHKAKEVSQVEVHSVKRWNVNFGAHKKSILIFSPLLLLVLVSASWLLLYDTKQDSQQQKITIQKDIGSTINNTQSANQQLNDSKNPEQKSEAYQELASAATLQGDNAKALEYSKLAVEATPSINAYTKLAFNAEKTGNYKLAADSYAKAAALSVKLNTPEGQYDYQVYLRMQKNAEAKL